MTNTLATRTFYQKGNTSLGIIVGVVLGLAVALGVSLYLASSNMPIKDKAANPAAKAPIAPKDANALPDPNESLYTKPKLDENVPAQEPLADLAGNKASPVNTPQKAKVEDDPIGKIAAAATPPKAASTAVAQTTKNTPVAMPNVSAPGAAGERLFVQVGAYKSLTDAEATRAKMALLGVSMQISSRDTDTGPIHRVRTLPLAAADAEKLREQLKSNSIEATVIKVQ